MIELITNIDKTLKVVKKETDKYNLAYAPIQNVYGLSEALSNKYL